MVLGSKMCCTYSSSLQQRMLDHFMGSAQAPFRIAPAPGPTLCVFAFGMDLRLSGRKHFHRARISRRQEPKSGRCDCESSARCSCTVTTRSSDAAGVACRGAAPPLRVCVALARGYGTDYPRESPTTTWVLRRLGRELLSRPVSKPPTKRKPLCSQLPVVATATRCRSPPVVRTHRVTGVVPAESKWQCSRVIDDLACLLCCDRRFCLPPFCHRRFRGGNFFFASSI
jgi:hypothetical protein